MDTAATKFAYFQGEIVPIEAAKVSVLTHALQYGTGAFGGMRSYWNADQEQMYIFRSHDHFERLLNSAALLRMKLDYTPQKITDILVELLQKEGFQENCYIRPLVYKSEETLGVGLLDIADDLTIVARPLGNSNYVNIDHGAHVCFSAWRRVDDNAIPARGKITGAYVNSMLIKNDAVIAGYDDALVLTDDGHVSEASTANVFIVRKGVAITPSITSNVLEGVVRRSLIQLLRDEMKIEVVERQIDRTEVYIADEVFMCGTGAQVSPVTQIEHRPVGNGQVGPITNRLRALFMDVVHGRVDQYRDWVTPVYSTEKAL